MRKRALQLLLVRPVVVPEAGTRGVGKGDEPTAVIVAIRIKGIDLLCRTYVKYCWRCEGIGRKVCSRADDGAQARGRRVKQLKGQRPDGDDEPRGEEPELGLQVGAAMGLLGARRNAIAATGRMRARIAAGNGSERMALAEWLFFPAGGREPAEESPPAGPLKRPAGLRFCASRRLANQQDSSAGMATDDGRWDDIVTGVEAGTAGAEPLVQLVDGGARGGRRQGQSSSRRAGTYN